MANDDVVSQLKSRIDKTLDDLKKDLAKIRISQRCDRRAGHKRLHQVGCAVVGNAIVEHIRREVAKRMQAAHDRQRAWGEQLLEHRAPAVRIGQHIRSILMSTGQPAGQFEGGGVVMVDVGQQLGDIHSAQSYHSYESGSFVTTRNE